LFSRIANKSTAFCSAVQRRTLRTRALCFVQRRSEIFLNYEQRHYLFSHSEKLLNCEQKNCILFSRAAKTFGIYQQKHLKSTVFCSDFAAKTFWNLSTKATRIDCILCCRAGRFFGIALDFVQQREKFWNCAVKFFGFANESTVCCSVMQRTFLELRTNAHFVQPRRDNFLNCEQKHCILFRNFLEFANRKNVF
jgi:hypothetical protein